MPTPANQTANPIWKWGVCGLLLLATMINYMDRLTLNQMSSEIMTSVATDDDQLYGWLETGFGLAFALSAFFSGLVVDRFGVRLYYPLMVVLWSAAGFATGFVRTYEELLLCRILLGVFESANWPCALYTTQKLLSAEQRTMGNGILQSGAAVGAIATPLIVLPFLSGQAESWRFPFMIIGALGLFWAVLWLILIRPGAIPISASMAQPVEGSSLFAVYRDRRFWVLALVVVAINSTWHFFRAWLPRLLQKEHGYTPDFTAWFMSGYYVATDLGSLCAGFVTLTLVRYGLSVHRSRMTTYLICAVIVLLTAVAAVLPRGYVLLSVLLVIGFAALGLFPTYYSFSQELSSRHQGKVTGSLTFCCWMAMAALQAGAGWMTKNVGYRPCIAVAGIPPLLGFFVLLFFWRSPRVAPAPQVAPPTAEPEAAAAPS